VRRSHPLLGYGVLALAVAGPLLAPGLVLTVDLAPVPHPHLASVYWGLPQGSHEGSLDRLPLDALFVLLGHIGAVAVGQKLLLLAIVFLAGLGMHRAAPARSEAGRYFAGLLYAVNPFVYDRLVTGQWYLLLGYALLPWAFRALGPLLAGDWRSAWRFGLVAVAVGIASAHMGMLLAVLAAAATVATLAVGTGPRRPVVGAVSLGSALALLPSLYWLLPTPGVRDLWRHVGSAQLDLYRTVPDASVGLAGTVAGLYGYWNDPSPVKDHLAAWPLLAAGLILLVLWGLRRRAADPLAWGVAAAGAIGLVVAMGGDGPTGPAFTWVVTHLEPARSFREPQKAVALLVFAYAYLGAAAVEGLLEHARTIRRVAPAAAVACSLSLPLVYGYRELGGLWGALSTSRYPASWAEADAILAREAAGSRTLFLPWHGYLGLSFAGGRGVANPAPAYFRTPVLASRSIGEGDAADNSDPVEQYVGGLLARAPAMTDLGACLAPLGVSHVLVAREADSARYAAVSRQRDLVLERTWGDLALYRSTVPTSLVLTSASPTPTGSCTAVAHALRPLPATAADPTQVRIPSVAEGTRTVVLTSSYRPDWSLGGTSSTPFLGAVNAFDATVVNGPSTIELSSFADYRRNYRLGLLGALLFVASWTLGRLRFGLGGARPENVGDGAPRGVLDRAGLVAELRPRLLRGEPHR
jgi:hypothetical protein